jgi:preprotein translocase subunit SecE
MSEKKAVAKTPDKKAAAKKNEPAKKSRFNLIKTFKDMWAELKKVTWPSRKELIRQSTVVIVFVLVLTVLVGLMDAGLSALLKLIIS